MLGVFAGQEDDLLWWVEGKWAGVDCEPEAARTRQDKGAREVERTCAAKASLVSTSETELAYSVLSSSFF